jgi:CheY-like chemotaxis protein
LGSGVAAAAPSIALLRGRRVLLVDDSDVNQLVARELLGEIVGMTVVVASNGMEAIELVRNQPFDVVLMDLQMPVLDGYGAVDLIRHEAATRRLPIIAMTAHATMREREKCAAVGMNDYVVKPFEPGHLFCVLLRWIDGGVVVTSESRIAPESAGQEPISFDEGLKRCLGSTELYERILNRFLTVRPSEVEAIRVASLAKDLESVAALAHPFISTAGTIGAKGLGAAAKALAAAALANEADRLSDLVTHFAIQHASVDREIRVYLSGRTQAKEDAPAA